MKFNSQICTTKEQSERLLALGLNKETADCYYYAQQRWTGNSYENTGELFLSPLWSIDDKGHFQYLNEIFKDEVGEDDTPYVLPAWSLHRLLGLLPSNAGDFKLEFDYPYEVGYNCLIFFNKGYLYDNIIDCIEWLIKEGHFNKEYLEE